MTVKVNATDILESDLANSNEVSTYTYSDTQQTCS